MNGIPVEHFTQETHTFNNKKIHKILIISIIINYYYLKNYEKSVKVGLLVDT